MSSETDLFDQVVDTFVEKIARLCEDKDKMERVYSVVLSPFMVYLAERFAWFVRAVQCLMSLIVLQTVLIMFLVVHVRSSVPWR